ncbi:MAG: serine hydrolase [Aliifodinibius sp.]|nr:serine hydrolase [candidate division Zixibacteria bacterium]NIT59227.1 serine hydrolase [Fodinibius sp.]NIW40488.1 serine hydrolase [candidate division Zixibacteria bacterium]NIX57811.1 serine hydrolase [candidate division Zixibacteria bacterium]NIY27810.1 serine hydrolase [Fodinibius sp.]
MKRAENVWGFMGTVLIAQGDSVLFRHGYGFANIAKKQPMTPEKKFLIGSITKSFTAIAIMQLWEKGKLDMDKTISEYLLEYPSDIANKITIHHLLSHQSGIPDFISIPGFQERAREKISTDELIAYFENLPLLFNPGERYTYSSSNYILLGKIIENVTGQEWAEYVKLNICEPAYMQNTGVYYDYDVRDDFAVGYNITSDGDTSEAWIVHPSCGYAAGGLASNIDDLYSLHKALYGSDILSQELIDSMLTSQTPFYGYGWLIDELAEHKLTAHGGGTPGFTSMFQRWIDDSVCVIVLSNNAIAPAHAIATGLAAIIFEEEYELPSIKEPMMISVNDAKEYEGVYQIDSVDYRIIEIEAEQLFAKRKDNMPMMIWPESKDKFYFDQDHMTTITFHRNDSGKIISHVIKQNFISDTAWLVKGDDAQRLLYGGVVTSKSEDDLERLTGKYKITPAGFTLTIKFKDGDLYAKAFDSPDFKMLPVSDTMFALEGLSARIIYKLNPDKPVDSIRFYQDGQTMVGIRQK